MNQSHVFQIVLLFNGFSKFRYTIQLLIRFTLNRHVIVTKILFDSLWITGNSRIVRWKWWKLFHKMKFVDLGLMKVHLLIKYKASISFSEFESLTTCDERQIFIYTWLFHGFLNELNIFFLVLFLYDLQKCYHFSIEEIRGFFSIFRNPPYPEYIHLQISCAVNWLEKK